MGTIKYRTAKVGEAQAIADLVNGAYRPKPEEAGWTHETDLIAGERTSAQQVLSDILNCGVFVILGVTLTGEIVSCVKLESADTECHLGMFSVRPAWQGRGLGKELLDFAERYAIANLNANVAVIEVVSARTALVEFYARRGYLQTGRLSDYPLSAGVGVPMVSGLKIEILEKDLVPIPLLY